MGAGERVNSQKALTNDARREDNMCGIIEIDAFNLFPSSLKAFVRYGGFEQSVA
jgi:hypothetical protein